LLTGQVKEVRAVVNIKEADLMERWVIFRMLPHYNWIRLGAPGDIFDEVFEINIELDTTVLLGKYIMV